MQLCIHARARMFIADGLNQIAKSLTVVTLQPCPIR